MAFDAYLKLDGIEGESTAKGNEKQIMVESFSWGASNPAQINPAGGGIGTGRVTMSSFSIQKRQDATSPELFECCCTGKHIKKGWLYVRKQGGDQGVFHELEFETLIVESLQWSGASGGEDVPTESVSFAFKKVTFGFAKQKPDGKMEAMKRKIWDITKVSAK
jgi:type VI secretion system secreted protein Hcp